MRFEIPEVDELLSGILPKAVLIFGEAGSGRTSLALRACSLQAEHGGKALYVSKGVPVIAEDALTEGALEGVMVGSFVCLEEIPDLISRVGPSLTVVDPVNGWSTGGMRGNARALSSALFEVYASAMAAGSELILVGDVIDTGGTLRPRHFREISRYCEFMIEMRKVQEKSAQKKEGKRWEISTPKDQYRSRCPSVVLGIAPL